MQAGMSRKIYRILISLAILVLGTSVHASNENVVDAVSEHRAFHRLDIYSKHSLGFLRHEYLPIGSDKNFSTGNSENRIYGAIFGMLIGGIAYSYLLSGHCYDDFDNGTSCVTKRFIGATAATALGGVGGYHIVRVSQGYSFGFRYAF